ncbi:MAG TPA: hypothetical protein VGW34_01020 [Allosphingosinicella sp.]|nr:hypothetical protein [Allosphingosinicella sp.]
MDRGEKPIRLLTAAALPLLLAAAADTAALPIAEARWLAPDHLLEDLSRQPSECFVPPADEAGRRSAAIGRAAFRAPLLLGGQAARAGLSCASCHRSGRGNPHFVFPGLSGAPGTADVTSSLMSRHRGDGSFNPKPIPDLAAGVRRVPRDRQSRALESFIRGLVVEEFDGPEPPPPVLEGLADYVRAMEGKACGGAEPVTLAAALAELDAAIGPALAAAAAGDRATMRLLVGAARSTLGRIDERYRLDGLEDERRLLREADAALRAIRQMAPAEAAPAMLAWQREWPARLQGLRRTEARSLFSPAVLRERLAGR